MVNDRWMAECHVPSDEPAEIVSDYVGRVASLAVNQFAHVSD